MFMWKTLTLKLSKILSVGEIFKATHCIRSIDGQVVVPVLQHSFRTITNFIPLGKAGRIILQTGIQFKVTMWFNLNSGVSLSFN